MNQILFIYDKNKNNKKLKIFKFIFFISIILIIFLLFYFIYTYHISNNKENVSSSLLNRFNIQRLYSEDDEYSIISLNENKDYFVIGSIEIPDIKINYPILSETNDELLKIAPCRFYGPFPNEIGNLCIAGHNYDDSRFFSNLYKLNIGNIINIYDINGTLIKYQVYKKYEIDKNNTKCTSQNTNGKREITLVTCNNLNGNRLIIKARV